MSRRCTICDHQQRSEIDAAVVGRDGSIRGIARRFGVSDKALHRHVTAHLPAAMVKAEAAAEVVRADGLLAQVTGLQQRAQGILEKAEKAKDHRTALLAIREARECLALQARILGELSDQPQVTVNVAVTAVAEALDRMSAAQQDALMELLTGWLNEPAP